MPPGEQIIPTSALDIFEHEIASSALAIEEVKTINVSHMFINFIKQCINIIENDKEVQQYFLSLIDSSGKQNFLEISEDKFLLFIDDRIYNPIILKQTIYNSFTFKCNKNPHILYNLFYKLIKAQRCTSANFGFSFPITKGHYRGCYLDFFHRDFYWPTLVYSNGVFIVRITPQPLHPIIFIEDDCPDSVKEKCTCQNLLFSNVKHNCIIS
jgi:hypothetical protein